jgi:hypothetical protein
MVVNRAVVFTHSNMESSINRGLGKESLAGGLGVSVQDRQEAHHWGLKVVSWGKCLG